MPMGKVLEFSALADELETDERTKFLVDVAAAQHPKSATRHLQELRRAARHQHRAAAAPPPPAAPRPIEEVKAEYAQAGIEVVIE